jgi:hypothetical protein
MTGRMVWASERIAMLAEHAKSESVQLSALRSILSETMTFSEFLGRVQRGTDITEPLDERSKPTTSLG